MFGETGSSVDHLIPAVDFPSPVGRALVAHGNVAAFLKAVRYAPGVLPVAQLVTELRGRMP